MTPTPVHQLFAVHGGELEELSLGLADPARAHDDLPLGVYEAANGDRFEGHWCDGVKEGPGRYFYASTGKIYEGEWVDGAPRCGSFRDATPEEANGTLPSADEQFSLPALSLLEPEALLAKRVAELLFGKPPQCLQ